MMRVSNWSQYEINDNLTKLENKIRTLFLPKLTIRVSPGDITRSITRSLKGSCKTWWFEHHQSRFRRSSETQRLGDSVNFLLRNFCQVKLIQTELQVDRNEHLLTYRRRTNVAPKERCCNRLSVLHTQEHLNWLPKDAPQTGSQGWC